VVQEAQDTYTVVALVAAAVGVALLPASAEWLQFEGVAFRPVTGADVRVPVALVWRPDDESRILSGFLEVAAELLP
jgi:DNA-binding transcriptional LysR family regulator